MSRAVRLSVFVLAALIGGGCVSSMMDPSADGPTVERVVPAGGASTVDPGAPIVVTFGRAMMAGMEMRLALHQDSVSGPVVAGTSAWSADRRTLTFTPAVALRPKTTYVLHLSPDLRDMNGRQVNFAGCGAGVGGRQMGSGMTITFTTA